MNIKLKVAARAADGWRMRAVDKTNIGLVVHPHPGSNSNPHPAFGHTLPPDGRGLRGSDLSRHASDVSRHATDVSRRVTDVGRRATDVGRRVTDVGRHATDVSRRATDVGRHATDVGLRATDVSRREILPSVPQFGTQNVKFLNTPSFVNAGFWRLEK